MSKPRWVARPPGSNWGDFGPDDQLGRLNWVDRAKVLEGIAEAREGLTFCLSLPLDYPGGSTGLRHPPRLSPTLRDGKPYFNYALAEHGDPGRSDVFSDDAVLLCLQYSTQWDALSHYGCLFDADGDGVAEAVYYNGYRAGEHILAPQGEPCRAAALGIETMAEHGVQGRAVLIDLHAHFGREFVLVGYEALRRILEQDGVEVRRGDMLCFHTGTAEMIMEMKGRPDRALLARSCAQLDGGDARLLEWITASGAAALIADNMGVEPYPYPKEHATRRNPGPQLPLHEHCLFKNGIPLGEYWYLTPLAEWLRANGRHAFLLTAPPLRLPGAVGSPPVPVATV